MKKIMFNDRFGLTDAVLEGRKTVTRRIAKEYNDLSIINGKPAYLGKQQYQVGEVVAIAQKYKDIEKDWFITHLIPDYLTSAGYTNKMFVKSELMPYKIEILNVRVERLQDITDEDCIKEGVKIGKCGNDNNWMTAYYVPNYSQPYLSPREAFAVLIDNVSKKGTWESNPYFFRYEFKLK